jgi:hypothetical protein
MPYNTEVPLFAQRKAISALAGDGSGLLNRYD